MRAEALTFCFALCCATLAQAGEREFQPSVAGVVLLHRPTAGALVPGAGLEFAATYGLSEWLAVGSSLSMVSITGVTESDTAAATLSYDATRVSVGPSLRLSPPQGFLPRHLGDLVVPSLGIGAGGAVERRSNQRLHRGAIVLRRETDGWAFEPLGWATLGIDLRPFRRLAVSIHGKYATPLTASFGDRADVSVALALSLFLYP